jgi:hypothetical protein
MPSRRTSSLRGNHFQDEIEVFFQKRGGHVHNQKPSASRVFTPKGLIFVSRRNDLFGAFDLNVLFSYWPPLYIQATLHTGIGAKKLPIDKLPWNPQYLAYEIWQKIPYKGVRILVKRLTADGQMWQDLGLYNLFKDESEASRYFQTR